MALVPLQYNIRSLLVRSGNTWLCIFSIAATVAVLAGILSLQQGFETIFASRGREDMVVLLRTGATSEGESAFDRTRAQIALNEIPEIATDANGKPLASAELYLATLLARKDGGKTNIPLRGVQPATFAIHGDNWSILDGRNFAPGTDEVVVGKALRDRIQNCEVGDTLRINVTPFRVVGVFESTGAYQTEVWGDVDRMRAALDVENYSRIIGVMRPGTSVKDLAKRLEGDKRIPAKALSEKEYLSNQTGALTGLFTFLGTFLSVIMGLAAVFTGTNAMLSALAARTHEIGILLATGFRPFAVFLSFQLEAALLGLLGGIIGVVMVIPLNGIQTGTTNFATFTEVTFAFRTTPYAITVAIIFALLLGIIGGAIPAYRASRLTPTQALRRG
ncbi:MAG: putative ABC transport system permease protein [Hyphomicrobiaceae bacterium]|jgi:putative ABC transport system permease protein